MASIWQKLTRPGPIDLGTGHIDSITVPDTYVQPFVSRATKANGYPFDLVAGTLEVLPWRGGDEVFHRYTTTTHGIVTRYYLNGSWRQWLDAMGKAVP